MNSVGTGFQDTVLSYALPTEPVLSETPALHKACHQRRDPWSAAQHDRKRRTHHEKRIVD